MRSGGRRQGSGRIKSGEAVGARQCVSVQRGVCGGSHLPRVDLEAPRRMATQELDAGQRGAKLRRVPRGVTLVVSGELYRATARCKCMNGTLWDGTAAGNDVRVRCAGQRSLFPRQW